MFLSHRQLISISTPNNLLCLLIYRKPARHSFQLKHSFIAVTVQRLDSLFFPRDPQSGYAFYMYPDELDELYRRQAEWTVKFAGHCIDLGSTWCISPTSTG